MRKVAEFIGMVVVALLLILLGGVSGYYYSQFSHGEVIETKTDTLFVRDTITFYEPIIEQRTKVEKVLVPVTDTVTLKDTLFVYLDRESIEWTDSLSTIWASGIQPSIDSVRHYVSEKVIVTTLTQFVPKPTKWGIGVQAGVGVGTSGLTPYVGIGLSYNLLSW